MPVICLGRWRRRFFPAFDTTKTKGVSLLHNPQKVIRFLSMINNRKERSPLQWVAIPIHPESSGNRRFDLLQR